MLFMKMDLLNYQYLDKMNNNIGILCYEGNCFISQTAFCGLYFTLSWIFLPFGLCLLTHALVLAKCQVKFEFLFSKEYFLFF